MYSILTSVVEVTSQNGEVVSIGRTGTIVPIATIVLAILVVAMVIFTALYKRRLEHKQIMAAIEKGTPLSDLKPVKNKGPAWIRNLTAGIILLIIGIALACISWLSYGDFAVDGRPTTEKSAILFIALVIFAVGVGRLIRGLLMRKAPQSNSATKNV